MVTPTLRTDAQGHQLAILTLEAGELADSLGWPIPAHNRDYRPELEHDMAHESDITNRAWRGGIRTLQQAADLLRDGWPLGTDLAATLAERLKEQLPEPMDRRRRMHWRDRGDEVSMERLQLGQYDRMWRSTDRKVQLGTGAVVTVAAQWGGNGNLTAQQLYWTGAALAALADLIDHCGLRCELLLIDAVKWVARGGEPRYLAQVVRLKDAGDPVSLDTLVTVAAHAGVYRSVGLALTHLAPFDTTSGLGTACKLDEVLSTLLEDGMPAPQIIVPHLKTQQQAEAFLLAAVLDLDAANRAALEPQL